MPASPPDEDSTVPRARRQDDPETRLALGPQTELRLGKCEQRKVISGASASAFTRSGLARSASNHGRDRQGGSRAE